MITSGIADACDLNTSSDVAAAALTSALAAASTVLACASNPGQPCKGNAMGDLGLPEHSPGRSTLQAALDYWIPQGVGGAWTQNLSTHWTITPFNRCAHAEGNTGPLSHMARGSDRALVAHANSTTGVAGVVFTLIPTLDDRTMAGFKNWATNLFADMRAPLVIFHQLDVPVAAQSEVQRLFANTGGVQFRPVAPAPDLLAHKRPTPHQPDDYARMCLFLGYEVYQVSDTCVYVC